MEPTDGGENDEQLPDAMVLRGVRVAEMGGGVASSLCARFLHGFGADVVRCMPMPDHRRVTLTADQRAYLLDGIEERHVPLTDLAVITATVDMIVSDRQPAELGAMGLDWQTLRAQRPELVVVSVTPFGLSGPQADDAVTNAVSFAAGGIMSLTGAQDRAPLVTGGDQAFALGAANAFAAATVAWFGRVRHGRGDVVDISMQECAASMLEYYGPLTSYTDAPGHARLGNQTRATWGIYPCADGWVGVFALARQVPALFALMGDPELAESRFTDALLRAEPENDAELAAKLYLFFSGLTMADVRELGLRSRVPFGVIVTPRELAGAATPADRGFWDTLPGDVPAGRVPGRPFPGFAWSTAQRKPAPQPPVPASTLFPGLLPFEGIRVLDLTMMWAGPFATLRMAEMGAEVIKVESPSAWDNIRTLIPQPDVEEPWNSAMYFNAYNRDKKSLTLDLGQSEGRELLLRLVRECDVVIENYRADVLDKLHLGYGVLRAQRPDVILISMAAFGKAGADRDLVGFGPVIEMMSGLCSLSGYGDGEPFKTGVSYGDPVAGTFAVAATALALLRRARTGAGIHVDLAQRETAAVLIGEAFVAATRGEDPRAYGNRDPRYAPQGCYPCGGEDRWIVVSVRDDADWAACASVIGAPELAALPFASRVERHRELDERITAWTARLHCDDAVAALRRAGLAAGAVLDTRDLLESDHLRIRRFWHTLAHPRMHSYKQQGVVWRFADAAPEPRRHSPLFGEHNRSILVDLLGLSEADLAALSEHGIVADAPRNPMVG